MSRRAVVCDDHPMFRRGVVECLNDEAEIVVVAEAANVAAGLAKLQLYEPDILVCDLALPDGSGFELLTWAKQHMPDLCVLILSMHTDLSLVRKARSLGASGFLAKEDAEYELLLAVRQATGGFHTSQSIGKSGPGVARLDVTAQAASLDLSHVSPAELRVLVLLSRSMTNRDIAGQLHVSVRTVEAHRYRLAEKLGAIGPNKLLELAILNRDQLERVGGGWPGPV